MFTEYVNSQDFKSALNISADKRVELEELAKGEYNINYVFIHPDTGKKLVFRVNTGSQMHLENQIEYEFNALKLIYPSKRTPRPMYADGSRNKLDYGVMVMEFLPGRALDYRKDMNKAAEILADIHSVSIAPDYGLVSFSSAAGAMMYECREMVKKYCESALAEKEVKRKILHMLEKGEKIVEKYEEAAKNAHMCCINTELNSGNFLINDDDTGDYLIDWEKPLYGDPAQDLGHFLAPTTTFWKTDVILKKSETEAFLNKYVEKVSERYQDDGLSYRARLFIPLNCLRGVTWSAMAWIEYQEPGRAIRNEFTFKKMCEYLKMDFLEVIDENFLE